MQNLLNWAERAFTVPNQSSNEFSGKNGAQTMTIPVTTGANRDATVLNFGLYRPITGANRGGCLQRARLITVETRTLRVSSRFTTVFDSNWAERAFTVPNQSSNEFSGKNGAQTMTIPVTTGANRDATVLNFGLYRPITGANRGGVFNVLG